MGGFRLLSSSYVFGIARNCEPMIQEASRCSSQMNQAIRDLYAYWNQLGAAEFHDRCLTWIGDMNRLQQALSSIQSTLNSHGQYLQAEERRRAAEEASRRAAALAAAAAAAQARHS
jgi:uncharacterized protein YukE